MTTAIHVIAGALCSQGQVLIAQRPLGKHLAGGWEFPGGKLHIGELPFDCLKRELNEELGIDVQQAEWLCECEHEYSDRHIHLELWLVSKFNGKPMSNEGQALKWVNIETLNSMDMLPADLPLIKELQKHFHDTNLYSIKG